MLLTTGYMDGFTEEWHCFQTALQALTTEKAREYLTITM